MTDDANRPAPDADLLDTRAGVVVVNLGSAAYGLPVDSVLEVLRPPAITRVPAVPESVCGVSNVRGQIVSVVDLGLRVGDAPAERPGRLVLVHHDASGSTVGLLVDSVGGIAPVSAGEEAPPAEAVASLPEGFFAGLTARPDGNPITILDLEAVLDLGLGMEED